MTDRERPDSLGSAEAISDRTFVEALLAIQSLVSRRAPPAVIYQDIVDGALRLLNGDGGSLRLVDQEDPGWSVAVAWHGSAGKGERWRHRAPITEGLSGRVIATGSPAVLEDYRAAQTGSQLAPLGTRAIIGVPIREHDRVVGSLVVASTTAGRRWSDRDWDLLLAYSEHVGAAIAVTRASQAVLQALTDPLTGLANRRMLLDRLEHELVRADRGGEPVSLLYMDLDGFKQINDSLGHSAGDELLVAVADRLRRASRENDVCARLGADEFAVILGGGVAPAVVAERIVDVLGRRFEVAGNEVLVSVSIGIVTGRAEAETLLRQADVAMYHAKRAGGGSYTHFDSRMNAALSSQRTLGRELQRALEHEQLELHYQPQVDLRSEAITGFEGLIRWRHPTRGLLEAAEFMPVAEETGIIIEIGRWALAHGCAQLADWHASAPLTLSLGVSTRELKQHDFADAVRSALPAALPPASLILEVSERQPLEGTPVVLETLTAVKQLGVRIALADFGSGYGTLLNLSRLPVDIIKIARAFVDALELGERAPDEPSSAGMLAGIVGLGRQLGLVTVAEGIERTDQRTLLRALGCDLGQGRLFGSPVDRAGAGRLVRAGCVQQP